MTDDEFLRSSIVNPRRQSDSIREIGDGCSFGDRLDIGCDDIGGDGVCDSPPESLEETGKMGAKLCLKEDKEPDSGGRAEEDSRRRVNNNYRVYQF